MYVPTLRQLPAFLITSWTKNIAIESSEGGNARRFDCTQASRYAVTILFLAMELLQRAADARTADNLAHVADTDTGRAGEGANDGRVEDSGGGAGQILGGVWVKSAGGVRPE